MVLLAEDNPITSQLIVDYLRHSGCVVSSVANGTDALAAVRATRPDILLLDIQMPGIDGFAVLGELRTHADPTLRTMRIIAMTAMAMPGDAERCLAAGANGYCAKPVRMRDLVALVMHEVGESRRTAGAGA